MHAFYSLTGCPETCKAAVVQQYLNVENKRLHLHLHSFQCSHCFCDQLSRQDASRLSVNTATLSRYAIINNVQNHQKHRRKSQQLLVRALTTIYIVRFLSGSEHKISIQHCARILNDDVVPKLHLITIKSVQTNVKQRFAHAPGHGSSDYRSAFRQADCQMDFAR